MYREIRLSASVMCFDWLAVGIQLKQLENSIIDYLHYDIVDGSFAPDFTMGSSIIDIISNASILPADYHLMVEEPSRIFEMFDFSTQPYFTIHQEACRNLHRDITKIKKMGGKTGVALSPATNLDTLEYIIEDIDLVTLMTVNPGYKGQPIVPQVLHKIEKARSMIERYKVNTILSVDGNVDYKNIPEMVSAGANMLVLGSSGLFVEGQSISESLEFIKEAIDTGLEV